MNLHSLLLGGITGYLIGSIPFAYIITKRHVGLDLRKHGSRNIGATNAYEVSGKKSVGGIVLALDFLKGLIPVLVFSSLGWYEPLLVLLPALVLGHCYPVWLGFHGGRGLATIAGAILLVNPALLVAWSLAYFLGRKIKEQVHFAATVATVVCLALILLAPAASIELTTLSFSGLSSVPSDFKISIIVVLLLILSRHIEPIISLVKDRKRS